MQLTAEHKEHFSSNSYEMCTDEIARRTHEPRKLENEKFPKILTRFAVHSSCVNMNFSTFVVATSEFKQSTMNKRNRRCCQVAPRRLSIDFEAHMPKLALCLLVLLNRLARALLFASAIRGPIQPELGKPGQQAVLPSRSLLHFIFIVYCD